jgi:hypothetical protein
LLAQIGPRAPNLSHSVTARVDEFPSSEKVWHEGFILFTERLSKRSKKASQRQPGLILIA